MTSILILFAVHLVRELFEKIDLNHREYISEKDLNKYLYKVYSRKEWPKERVMKLLKDVGKDSKGKVTWLAFALTENVLPLFHVSYAAWQKSKNKKRDKIEGQKKLQIIRHNKRRNKIEKKKTNSTLNKQQKGKQQKGTRSTGSGLPSNLSSRPFSRPSCPPRLSSSPVRRGGSRRKFKKNSQQKNSQQNRTVTKKWTPSALDQKKIPQRPLTAQHRRMPSHHQQQRTTKTQTRPKTASIIRPFFKRVHQKETATTLRQRLTKSPLSTKTIDTIDPKILLHKQKKKKKKKKQKNQMQINMNRKKQQEQVRSKY